jgi:hypothetical protein
MRRRHGFLTIALGVLLMAGGCGRNSPTAPATSEAAALSGDDGGSLTSSAYSVTLNPNNSATPSSLAVASGYKVLFVNNSGRPVALHSYNCSEFSYMSLNAGYSKNTLPFNPAGKTCDYTAYDTNYQKIFVGRITVN